MWPIVLRVALDATSLHGARTGVGVFASELLSRLGLRSELDVAAFAVTWRGRGRLAELVPPGVRAVGRPMAAQPLRQCWRRVDHPRIDWWIGAADVVHGPNYVVPPTRGAAEVVTIHDLTPWRFPELTNRDTRAYPGLVARAVRRGAWVHTVSRFVADEVLDLLGVAPKRLVTIPNGASALPPCRPGTDAAAGRSLAGGDRYVLSLGTVEPRKGLPALVSAFDGVAAADPDVRLVLAGPDGWGADALTAAIAAAHHRDRILRLGWVGGDDRAALLRGATAFAYPSRYEGFGLPPLEAMAAGVPVLTTTAGALPEVVGDAAVLVPPDDVDELAGALAAMLADPARRDALVRAGRERLACFSWERCAEEMVDLYRSADAAR